MCRIRWLVTLAVSVGLSASLGRALDNGSDPRWYEQHKARSRLAAGDPDYHLIHVQVIAVEEQNDASQIAQLKITRVFSGSQTLRDTVIKDRAYSEGSNFGNIIAIPKYKVGDQFVCDYWSALKQGVRIRQRYRDDWNPPKQVLAWAETVESLTKLNPRDRREKVKALCADSNSYIAQFCVSVILAEMADRLSRPAAEVFLYGLAKDKAVSFSTLIYTDSYLLSLDRENWIKAPERGDYFKRWAGPLTDEEAIELTGHLNYHVSNSILFKTGMTPKQVAGYVHAILLTPKRGEKAWDKALSAVFSMAFLDDYRGEMFKTLVAVAQSHPDQKSRLQAAQTIANFTSEMHKARLKVTPEQVRTVRKLHAAEKDPEIAKWWATFLKGAPTDG